jgi:hypothetical protein
VWLIPTTKWYSASWLAESDIQVPIKLKAKSCFVLWLNIIKLQINSTYLKAWKILLFLIDVMKTNIYIMWCILQWNIQIFNRNCISSEVFVPKYPTATFVHFWRNDLVYCYTGDNKSF